MLEDKFAKYSYFLLAFIYGTLIAVTTLCEMHGTVVT